MLWIYFKALCCFNCSTCSGVRSKAIQFSSKYIRYCEHFGSGQINSKTTNIPRKKKRYAQLSKQTSPLSK